MAKNLEATMAGVTTVRFRQAKGTDIIEVGLVDAEGEEFKHALWTDGQGGPDKAIENAKASLKAYGWDGKDLASLGDPKGIVEHLTFPDEGVEVVYRVNEFTDSKGTPHAVNQVRYIKGIGGGELDKEGIKRLEAKFNSLSAKFDPDEEII